MTPIPLRYQEGFFSAAESTNLFFRRWDPAGNCRGTVVFIHGLGEHSGTYENLVNFFVSQNYRVAGFDLRGHGRSPGQRGHIRAWSEFREDLNAYIHFLTPEENLPLFLFGHSLGGAIALDFVLHQPSGIAGLMLSAPALQPAVISAFVWKVARFFDRLFPRFSLPVLRQVRLKSDSSLTPDSEDPLLHSRGSARLGMETRRTLEWINKNLNQLSVPVVIFHSEGDAVAAIEGSRQLAAQAPVGRVTLFSYPGEAHELFNSEEHGAQVCAAAFRWVVSHRSVKNLSR